MILKHRKDHNNFWNRVVVPSDALDTDACWLWTGEMTISMYGKRTFGFFPLQVADAARGGKNSTIPYYAQEVSYEIFLGDIPRRSIIHSSCGVSRCVSPHHFVTDINYSVSDRHTAKWV